MVNFGQKHHQESKQRWRRNDNKSEIICGYQQDLVITFVKGQEQWVNKYNLASARLSE